MGGCNPDDCGICMERMSTDLLRKRLHNQAETIRQMQENEKALKGQCESLQKQVAGWQSAYDALAEMHRQQPRPLGVNKLTVRHMISDLRWELTKFEETWLK